MCSHKDAIGLDCYNQALTGNKTMPVTASASDPNHVPCVIVIDSFFDVGTDTAYSLKARDYKEAQVVMIEVKHE